MPGIGLEGDDRQPVAGDGSLDGITRACLKWLAENESGFTKRLL
jgi:hypothetical protein